MLSGQPRFDFTISGFRQRLHWLKLKHYAFSKNFLDSSPNGFVFLRHDVDVSLDLALRIAEVELAESVHATYFISLTSPFYNALSKSSSAAIRQIHEMGHGVGLHFDSFGQVSDLEHRIVQEAAILEQIIGADVEFFSQHKPTSQGWIAPDLPSIWDVRQQCTHGGIPYVSDSTGVFRWGDYEDLIPELKSFQLLIHPVWWSSEEPMHPVDSIKHFRTLVQVEMERELSQTISNLGFPLGSKQGWPINLEREELK